MSSAACTIFGSAILALLLAGYLAQQYLPPPKPKIIGIDLGTTYSCVGVYHAVSGQARVIPDADGHKCIPSVVAFNGEDVVVGYPAVAMAAHKPSNTLYDAKRFIGKRMQRSDLEAQVSHYPFKLEPDEYGNVRYVMQQRNQVRLVTPEQIGSYILRTLRKTAEQNLTVPVMKAVMSVPAEFDDYQRNRTKEAARLAGIDVVRMLSEPTAAALAYGLHKVANVQRVVVVDLGGGTLDVSLLRVQGGMFLTQAMAGNNNLGGQDFNERLMKYLLAEIQKQFNRVLTDPEDLQSLRSAVEEAKLQLTQATDTTVSLPLHSLSKGHTFQHHLTRSRFEALNLDLFKKVLEPVRVVLQETELKPSDIDEVVLVGGSTRIPRVRQLIGEFFGKDPSTSTNPELAVVTGVAIQAGIIGGAWPLKVSATEVRTNVRKIQVH